MSRESWEQFLESLRAERNNSSFYASKEDFARFAKFAGEVRVEDRIPLLLHAYDRYRALAACCDPNDAHAFETSCYSILISTILRAGIQPNQHDAAEILRRSYHRCGHGSDVEPPLTLAEGAFRNHPYSKELFDGIRAYRETLRISRGSHAANIKRKLGWVMWHDPRRVEKHCHTRRIQQTIHALDAKTAFHWQWLLRNVAGGLQAAPGKGWIKEGRKRLEQIGEDQFLAQLDHWFTFPEKEVHLSAAGSVMLRLLVWYAALVNVERSLPVLVRVAHVRWNKRAPVGKVMSALSWVLRSHSNLKFEAEVWIICDKFAGESAEVKRLEERYFPEQSQIRQCADQEEREQMSQQRHAQMEETLRLLRESHPSVFGPDSPAGRFIAAQKTAAESKTTT